MPVHQTCLTRHARLLDLIPFQSAGDFPGTGVLLEKMADVYTGNDAARRRRVERDLDELLQTGQIEVTNPGGKPRLFRRLVNDAANDPRLMKYIEAFSKELVQAGLPRGRHERLWAKLLNNQQRPLLPEMRFRAISDSQRLLPAEMKPSVLVDVMAALIQRLVVEVGYRKKGGSLQWLHLHPQGLLQRGPILYLYALKDDETSVKMFALHRMTSATLVQKVAHDDPDFNLDQRIHDGDADFGDGSQIELKLRVRGYILGQLRDCKLSENQQIEDEDEDSDFDAVLTATLPSTGQLYRWLLGCGKHVEVIAPQSLREVMARTATATAAMYQRSTESH